MSHFPEVGQSRDEILAALTDFRARDLKNDGRAFAFIYDAGQATRELARDAFSACMSINGLDPTMYPSARTIENTVVGACLSLVRAPEGAVGTATAGGTESVMLAVKSARDFARKTRPHIQRPKMLLPLTAHACFHKAAHYLGVDVITVDVDPVTFRADANDARAKMTDDVILVVGSAPSYAHGVIDPIEALASLAKEYGALMHVDACVGGLALPFLREIGVDVAPFDFSVDGVTSMSMDLHKYGFAPKGASVLVQRNRALRDAQYFACASWTGYPVVNSTTLGSKSLSALGGAYAVMHHLGRSGYREIARSMWGATQTLVKAIESTPGLRMLGRPEMNLFAFTTVDGDLFELADRLGECGWHVQVTYGFGPSPANIHLTLEPGNSGRADEFARDLATCMRDLPAKQVVPEAMVAMLEQVGSGDVDASEMMGQLGITNGQLPGRASMIHRLIESVSPAARERLLVLFMGGLFS